MSSAKNKTKKHSINSLKSVIFKRINSVRFSFKNGKKNNKRIKLGVNLQVCGKNLHPPRVNHHPQHQRRRRQTCRRNKINQRQSAHVAAPAGRFDSRENNNTRKTAQEKNKIKY